MPTAKEAPCSTEILLKKTRANDDPAVVQQTSKKVFYQLHFLLLCLGQ